MDSEFFIEVLHKNSHRIFEIVDGISDDQARWKPSSSDWSILEVINHLYDEEKEDFKIRLDITLHKPDKDWPPIDPEGWVQEREYNSRDLGDSVRGFLEVRERSIHWLKTLSSVDWNAVYQAPFGEIAAGDIFASWVAHDLLHTRQLIELHWAYTTHKLEPYSVDYAGSW
jgi:hypothetical protein